MRPVTLTQTEAGSTAVCPMDLYQAPFAVGLNVRVTGTVNYTVEHTFDDVFAAGFDPDTANWMPHSTLAAETASADSNYAFPVRGIRLTVNSGDGTAVLTIVQATGSNA